MTRHNALLLALVVALLLPAGACKKVPNTTPRYIHDACLVCVRVGDTSMAGKCIYCKAPGTCQFCQGKGKRMVGKGASVYQETCAFCQGSGKCHYCSGTGKCAICGGTGKYTPFKPQETPPQPEAVPAPPKTP